MQNITSVFISLNLLSCIELFQIYFYNSLYIINLIIWRKLQHRFEHDNYAAGKHAIGEAVVRAKSRPKRLAAQAERPRHSVRDVQMSTVEHSRV